MRSDPYGNPLPDRMHYRRDGYEHVTSKRGKRTWTRLGTNYPQALAHWARIEGMGVGENAATIAEIVEAYLIEHADRLAPKTMRGYRNSQKRINDWAGAVYGEELTRSSVRTWLHADGKGREVSANRDLALLKAALNLAVEMDLLSVNPAMGVRRLPERPRTRSGTGGELEALGKVATPMWCAIISTALFTGMRESEIRLHVNFCCHRCRRQKLTFVVFALEHQLGDELVFALFRFAVFGVDIAMQFAYVDEQSYAAARQPLDKIKFT